MRVEGVATGSVERAGGAVCGRAPLTRAIAAAEAGGEDESEKDGTEPEDGAARALGVDSGDPSFGASIFGGGGGIAARSPFDRALAEDSDACADWPWLALSAEPVLSDGCLV